MSTTSWMKKCSHNNIIGEHVQAFSKKAQHYTQTKDQQLCLHALNMLFLISNIKFLLLGI